MTKMKKKQNIKLKSPFNQLFLYWKELVKKALQFYGERINTFRYTSRNFAKIIKNGKEICRSLLKRTNQKSPLVKRVFCFVF